MLILTDRAKDGLSIHAMLAQRGRCQVVDVRQAPPSTSKHQIIVCDIDLANPSSVKLAAAALPKAEGDADVPVLVLGRNGGGATGALPTSLRATEFIHNGAPPALILAVAKRLINEHQSRKKRLARPVDARESALDAAGSLSSCLNAAKRSEAVSPAELEKGATIVLSAVKQTNIRSWLNVVRRFDDATYQHCLLVAGLVAALSIKLGLTAARQNRLTQAALIHDVGKSRVNPSILNKPGALSKPEKDIMQTHVTLGYEMLVRQNNIVPVILDVVRHHHECLDGTGYPDGLKGSQISDSVRIVTICDIYAALIERRPYKTPMPPAQALAVLSGMGPKLDKELLKIFAAAVAETE